MTTSIQRIARLLHEQRQELLQDWLRALAATSSRRVLMGEGEQRSQCEELLALLRDVLSNAGSTIDVQAPAWGPVRDFLADVTRSRSRQGFSPVETATFVFSLKEAVLARLRTTSAGRSEDELWSDILAVDAMLDRLGLFTTEINQKTREEVIVRQQEEMLELSTPVVRLWEGVLALPMIGTLDSGRTQVVMEALLQRILEERAPIAILDITGVPTVDTMTAQHLLKTVAAARLMGAECIISGIRPQIAQTIVHLGVDLGDVTTKATLADAFEVALRRAGKRVVPLA